MASINTAVTVDRFSKGAKSFNEWIESINSRQDQFTQHYKDYVPEESLLKEFQEIGNANGLKILILGEEWCPDVWRGLPVLAKITENTKIEVRYLVRDDNQDIMSEFLNGEFQSIPTIIFYDKDLNYLFHWIERPEEANTKMSELRDKHLSNVPNEGEIKDAAMKAFRKEISLHAESWRHLTLQEFVSKLKESLQ
jgi:hypothetical protein